ncbi:Calcium-binding protein 39-like [Ranunculus cassubicifolius]
MLNLNCFHPSSTPKDPISLLDFIHNTLLNLPQNPSVTKSTHKTLQFSHYITTLREFLYGSTESEPNPKICSQITQKFFARDTLRLIILHFSQLNLQIRNDLYTLVTNLENQKDLVDSRFRASEYFEKNKDLVDKLILGYENKECALQYGPMLRGAIKHQNVARYVLGNLKHMNKFFELLEIGNFGVSSDVWTTYKELMTRHKSTVFEFLSDNYDWFFAEYKCTLLASSVCINRRCAVQLLGDILRGKANAVIRRRYVSSLDNLKIVMNLLDDTSKITQMEAFRVFKLFVDNEDKPEEIVDVLAVPENKLRIVRLCEDLTVDKPYEQFEEDKAEVVKIFKD